MRALTPPLGWQGIETAPKDTPLLMWCERDGVGTGDVQIVHDYKHEWVDDETMKRTLIGSYERISGTSATGICMHRPTHWMPLPPPPTEQANEGCSSRKGVLDV